MSKGNIFVLMFLLSTFIVSCKFWGEIDRKRGRAGLNIDGFSNLEDKDKLLKDGFEFQVGDVETNDKDKLAQGDVADSSSNTKTGIVDDKDKLALGDAQDGNASAGSTGSGQESQSFQSSVASNSSTGLGDVGGNDKLLQGSDQGSQKNIDSTGGGQGLQSSSVASSGNIRKGSTGNEDKTDLGDAQGGGASAGSTVGGQGLQSSSVVSNDNARKDGTVNKDKTAQGDVKDSQSSVITDRVGVVKGNQGTSVASSSNSGADSVGGKNKLNQSGVQAGAGAYGTGSSTGSTKDAQSGNVASSSNSGAGSAGNEYKTDLGNAQGGVTAAGNTGVVKGNQGTSVASSSNTGADSVVSKDKLAQGGGANSGGAGSSVRDVQGSNVTSSSNTEAGSASSKDKLAQETQNGSSSVTSGVAGESRVPQRRIQHRDEMRHNANKEKEHRHPDLGVVNKSLDRGLTQEDVKSKFNILVSQVEEYENMLRHVYNDYIGASNTIRTYSKDNNGSYTSEIRRGLDKLNDRGLYDSLKRLGNIIKDHKHQGLTIAISRLKEAVGAALASERASHAIEASNAYISAINSAIVAYVESFAAVASTLSSGQFAQAAQKFAEVARACTAINKTDISTIAWAVSGVFLKNKGNLDQAKRIASRLYGRKGGELSRAIDELDAAYKGLK
ncbi:hypothetical protein [Borrelia sp. RT1S]|uniref:hypothetical protein n=1 Tax=Borrelia sp. RT1S TaxID=2898580 RepID=UPI001E526D72|nr:hypothetical protein [Borrelia sp. RT1S]UGQ18019.1 hypothetical protein LSO05_06180 [Borrelia sp. RT1S]